MDDAIELGLVGEPHKSTWLAEEDPHLGERMEIDNLVTKLRGFIGESPVAVSAASIAENLGLASAPWTAQLEEDGIKSVFVGVGFGIEHRARLSPSAVGIELLFMDQQQKLNIGQRIHVHSLFPSPEYKVIGEAELKASAELSANGEFRATMVPPGILSNENSEDENASLLPLDAGGHAKAVVSANGNFNLSTELRTPLVSAMGIGDHRAWWCLHKGSQELTGEDIMTWSGLALSSDRPKLAFKAKVFVVFNFRIYRFRRESAWVDLSVDL